MKERLRFTKVGIKSFKLYLIKILERKNIENGKGSFF